VLPNNKDYNNEEYEEFNIDYENNNRISFDFLEDQVAFSYYMEFRKRVIHKLKAIKSHETIQKESSKKKERGDFVIKDPEDIDDSKTTYDPTIPAFNPHKHVEIGTISEEDITTTFNLASMDFDRIFTLEKLIENSFGRGPQ